MRTALLVGCARAPACSRSNGLGADAIQPRRSLETNSIGPCVEPELVGTARPLVLDGRLDVAR